MKTDGDKVDLYPVYTLFADLWLEGMIDDAGLLLWGSNIDMKTSFVVLIAKLESVKHYPRELLRQIHEFEKNRNCLGFIARLTNEKIERECRLFSKKEFIEPENDNIRVFFDRSDKRWQRLAALLENKVQSIAATKTNAMAVI